MKNFESAVTVENVSVPLKQKSARSVVNVAAACEPFEKDSNQSLTLRSRTMEMEITTMKI